MRLWSLHPQYLDAKGLVALWREGLLAQEVLAGRTRGYRHHPQLARFKAQADPLAAIGAYLETVRAEAQRRGYRFSAAIQRAGAAPMAVTRGQLRFERAHLQRKLWRRDRRAHARLCRCRRLRSHPLFTVRAGPAEPWEIRQ